MNMYVCVCVRACVRVCVCVCVYYCFCAWLYVFSCVSEILRRSIYEHYIHKQAIG